MRNSQLHEKALRIVRDYNKNVIELLDVLQELDRLGAYNDYQCRSLYDYCVKILKLSQDVALNFIRIARASVKVPEIKERIKSGELNVSNARKVASVITPENAKHWIELAISLPQQKLEKEIAKVAPKAAVPDQVKILSEDYVEFRTTLSQGLLQKLKRARDLESQRTSKAADYEQVLSQALDLYLEACDPVRKAERIEKKKKSQKTKEPETKDQHVENLKIQESSETVLRPSHIEKIRKPIPAAIKNAVLLRDKGRCTHVDTSEQRCEQERWIHTHHLLPVSQGGGNEIENLISLCSFHHDLAHQLDLFT